MYAVLATLLALLPIEPVKIPSDPGLYYLHGKEVTRVEARSVTLGTAATRGPKIPMKGKLPMSGSGKMSAAIVGDEAEHKLTATPVFYYRAGSGNEGLGSADLVLVKLKVKRGHREFQVSAAGDWKTSSGIPLRSQVQFFSKQVESGVYQLTPSEDLDPGEYGFYVFRGRELPGLIYDFSVE